MESRRARPVADGTATRWWAAVRETAERTATQRRVTVPPGNREWRGGSGNPPRGFWKKETP